MSSRLRKSLQRAARVAIAAAVLGLAAGFASLLHSAFRESSVAIAARQYGTARAPYSDALDPWLDGSLSYFVCGRPLNYIYRPTVALFYSTVISITGSIASVPVAWIALLFAASGAFFILMDWPHRVVLGGLFGAWVILFNELTRWLFPASEMVDFWPMAASFVGIWFIALGEECDPPGLLTTASGFILLGIAGCVRGLPLAAGVAILALLAPGRIRRRQWWSLAIMAACFAAPSVIDSAIRRWYGIESNSAPTLYAVYSDPLHTWTISSEARYLREKPPLGVIYSHYLGFLLSPPGIRIFLGNCGLVISQAAKFASGIGFLAGLLALTLLGWLAGRSGEPATPQSQSRATKGVSVRVGLIATTALLSLDARLRPFVFAVLIGIAVAYTVTTGRRLAAMLMVAFCATLAFHAALGLVDGQRLLASYEFLLLAGLVAALCEAPHTAALRPRFLPPVAGVALTAVLVGYTGNFWLRTGYKAGLRAALDTPHTVMKISNSQPLDRSLYLTNDGYTFYTRYDPAPFGTVRSFRHLPLPEGAGSPTFIHPVPVDWAPVSLPTADPP